MEVEGLTKSWMSETMIQEQIYLISFISKVQFQKNEETISSPSTLNLLAKLTS